jgi:hypothetical protein
VNNISLRLEDNVMVLLDNTSLVILANNNISLESVGKGVPVCRERLGDLATGADLNVEEPDGCVGEILDRVDAVTLARNDLDSDLVIVNLGDGDLRATEVAIPRFASLQILGKVNPKLKTDICTAILVLSGHFSVHNA